MYVAVYVIKNVYHELAAEFAKNLNCQPVFDHPSKDIAKESFKISHYNAIVQSYMSCQ